MMRGFATFRGKHRFIATEGSNIILSEAKNIISPQAMHHLKICKAYALIYLRRFGIINSPTKVRFLNDVCLRQMMTASPNDVRFANDAWLRHILRQTSHHCGTKCSNIILSKAKNIISPQAMHHLIGKKFYDIINSPINKNLTRRIFNENL